MAWDGGGWQTLCVVLLPTACELRSLLLDQRVLPLGIAGLYPEDFRDRSGDHRLIALLYAMCRDLGGLLEPEERQRRNQSYHAYVLSQPRDSEAHAKVLMLHKSFPLLTVASYGRPHQGGAPWDSGWLGSFVDLGMNWTLLDEVGWLYLPPEACNVELTQFEIPQDLRHEVDYVARYGSRTLGALAFNCAD